MVRTPVLPQLTHRPELVMDVQGGDPLVTNLSLKKVKVPPALSLQRKEEESLTQHGMAPRTVFI